MKKLIFCLACVFAFAACATTGTEQTTTQRTKINPEDVTLENALKKSQELRGQVEDAKTAYKAAQAANQATNATDGIKDQVNKQIETAKKQIKEEADAWKNVAK
jgi:hypothetical protein